jgi:hypothetical protein
VALENAKSAPAPPGALWLGLAGHMRGPGRELPPERGLFESPGLGHVLHGPQGAQRRHTPRALPLETGLPRAYSASEPFCLGRTGMMKLMSQRSTNGVAITVSAPKKPSLKVLRSWGMKGRW